MLQQLFEINEGIAGARQAPKRRYLYTEIDWQDRLIEITGARGFGKTTLMLQKVSELNRAVRGSALYASLEHPHFFSASLQELAGEFYRMGGKYLFLDEVHKYPPKQKNYDWSAELKAAYDEFPGLHIIYSGSSIIRDYKGQGDLSRWRSSYTMKGFSFREYLYFEDSIDTGPFPLSKILSDHSDISREISTRIKVFPFFKEYLERGFYPFYKESKKKFQSRLIDILNEVLETDIPSSLEISYESIFKIKKLLASVAGSIPDTPNLSNLRSVLNISDSRTLLNYLNLLEKSEIISNLSKNGTRGRIVNKPDKIYLNNTNLLKILSPENLSMGTVRETFFFNQIRSGHTISYTEKGDFLADSRFLFEIGGRDKEPSELENMADAYLALDDIEVGLGKRIPLWLFGFLY